MNIPANLLYTKDHEWILVEGNTGTVGVTDFAQHQLGDIVFIEVDTEGETVEAGEVFGTIEAVKTVSDMFMPVTGKVLEFNSRLADHPELVNQDPYDQGWIIKVELTDLAALSALLPAAEYQKIVEE